MDITMNRLDNDGWATDEEVTVDVVNEDEAYIWTPYGRVEACKILTDAEMDQLAEMIERAAYKEKYGVEKW